jgi:hypothetical protein
MGRQKLLDLMVASFTGIQSALDFHLKQIQILLMMFPDI